MKTFSDVIPAKMFAWNANKGIAEASHLFGTLGRPLEEFHVDGKERSILFKFTSFLRDGEGDVAGWNYKSSCNRYTITIYND